MENRSKIDEEIKAAQAALNLLDVKRTQLQERIRQLQLSDEIIRYHLTGSHRIWYSPTGYRLPIQEGRSGKAKGFQVEQFLGQYEVENEKA